MKHMARRSKKNSRSRPKYKGAFKIFPALFAYANLHILMVNSVGTSPWNFFTAGTKLNPNIGSWGTESGQGGHKDIITLKELIAGVQTSSSPTESPITQIGNNLMASWPNLLFSMVGLRIAQKVIARTRVRTDINKLSDALGTSQLVRA